MKSSGDEARKQLAMQLATGFAAACMDYLPVIEEGVRRTSQRIGFGARVEIWRGSDGMILGRLSTSAPRIPAETRPRVDFVLQMDTGGQLELVFEGTPKQLKARFEEG